MINDSSRFPRVEINRPCVLNPWEIQATLDNMSLSGALINCEEFPRDLLTATKGELYIENIIIPGEFVRLNKLNIAIEFSSLNPEILNQIKLFLSHFQK